MCVIGVGSGGEEKLLQGRKQGKEEAEGRDRGTKIREEIGVGETYKLECPDFRGHLDLIPLPQSRVCRDLQQNGGPDTPPSTRPDTSAGGLSDPLGVRYRQVWTIILVLRGTEATFTPRSWPSRRLAWRP